jgi:SAM-dependent methyltransferase
MISSKHNKISFNRKELEENHIHYLRRLEIYRRKGLDHKKSRDLIVKNASLLNGLTLEIGTGHGHTTLALAKAGYNFIAIDRSFEMIRSTMKNLAYEELLDNTTFYIMDTNSLGFKNEIFSNIISVNLFHHLHEFKPILKEMNRILVSNGRLVIADFNKKGREIINEVHDEEGRKHEDFGVEEKDIFSFLVELGYNAKNIEEKYYWILIAEKNKNG